MTVCNKIWIALAWRLVYLTFKVRWGGCWWPGDGWDDARGGWRRWYRMASRWLKINGWGCEGDDGGKGWDVDGGDCGDEGSGGHGDGGVLGGWGEAKVVDENMANSKYNIYEQLLLCFFFIYRIIITSSSSWQLGSVLMMMISTSCTRTLMIAV